MSSLLKQYGPKPVAPPKQYTNAFNPFNSWKVAYHADRMKSVLNWLRNEGASFSEKHCWLPPPVYVTIDPTNVCNHGCPWCISSTIQESDNTTLKESLLVSLADAVCDWTGYSGERVGAVVLAGGGEPLANPATKKFIEVMSQRMHYAIDRVAGKDIYHEYAMITNGELLTSGVAAILAQSASWVGFSVDSGNSESHRKMHAPKKKSGDNFAKIIENIRMLSEWRKAFAGIRKTPLNIGYKFNIHPDSYESIYEAAALAKSIGCDQIQYKPTYLDNAFEVMPPIIDKSQELIARAREELEDDKFRVIGMIHKFGPSWQANHDFGACTMTPLGLIFSADGNMYLCCDRRGEPSMNLGRWHNGSGKASLFDIMTAWGSDKHRELINAIDTKDCPRCTFYHYNKMATEQFVTDSMNRSFL